MANAVVAAGELLFGASNSRRHLVHGPRYERFFMRAVVLPVTLDTACVYARLRLELKQAGRPIPENDTWIAASCLEHNLVLATSDGHFGYCSGLTTENWLLPPSS